MEGNENSSCRYNIAIDDCMASPNVENDDCRINCTDRQSLRAILDITLDQISEFAHTLSPTDHPELTSHFSDSFKNALEENILLNGLPLRIDESSKLTSHEKEKHRQIVDDALLSKLSKTISHVAHKRKYCPEQCCRILNIQMKHELQNMKKAKVVNSCASTMASVTTSTKDRKHIKKFSEFCKNFNNIQKIVQHRVQERENFVLKIETALNIKKQQKLCLRSEVNDVDITLKK